MSENQQFPERPKKQQPISLEEIIALDKITPPPSSSGLEKHVENLNDQASIDNFLKKIVKSGVITPELRTDLKSMYDIFVGRGRTIESIDTYLTGRKEELGDQAQRDMMMLYRNYLEHYAIREMTDTEYETYKRERLSKLSAEQKSEVVEALSEIENKLADTTELDVSVVPSKELELGVAEAALAAKAIDDFPQIEGWTDQDTVSAHEEHDRHVFYDSPPPRSAIRAVEEGEAQYPTRERSGRRSTKRGKHER